MQNKPILLKAKVGYSQKIAMKSIFKNYVKTVNVKLTN